MTFLDCYVMCVMKATWEVCINIIKVLVEVVLPRCLSGREIINVNEDSSTSTRRVLSRAKHHCRELIVTVCGNWLKPAYYARHPDCRERPVYHLDHAWRSNCWDISDSPPICKAVIGLQCLIGRKTAQCGVSS